MALIALLFAHHGVGAEGEPPTTLDVAGVSVVERQVRQVRAAGASRVLVVVERMPPRLATALDRADVEIVRVSTGIVLDDGDRVLVLADSLFIDTRAITAVLAKDAPALAVWRGRSAYDGAERLDPSTHWAGIALYPGRLIVETLAGLGEWDLQATLLRAAHADGRPARIDLGAIDASGGPLVWRPIRDAGDAHGATQAQLAAGEVEHRDWPSRWVHSPIEAVILPKLLAREVDPKAPLVAATTSAAVATLAFAIGWYWLGLSLAILSGPLFGLQNRLVHARGDEAGEFKRFERAALVIEASWYLAFALSFGGNHEIGALAAVTVLIFLGLWGNASVRDIYKIVTGRSFDDAGESERLLRLLGGHRNALLWSLLPFAAFGIWWAGLVWAAAYTTITLILSQRLLLMRLRKQRPLLAQSDRLIPPAGRSSPTFDMLETTSEKS